VVAASESFSDVLLSQQAGVPAPFPARIQAIVGQIGTGSFVAEFQTDYGQGDFTATDQELDVALEQGFFAIQDADGGVYYTRAGRFQRDAEGGLVNVAGLRVLGTDGQPINIGGDRVRITGNGAILQDNTEIARLQVLDFDPATLRRAGEAYFAADEPGTEVQNGVRQGFLEGSNSVLTEEMTSLMAVQRTFQANQTLFAQYDQSLELAVGQLGTWRR
jgi:flagellar basal-body rod protein FlgG